MAATRAAVSQQSVPVRELSAPDAKSTQHFGTILGVRPLAGGRVLVNDAGRRQLIALDANFGSSMVVLDKAGGIGPGYGPYPAPLIPYLADSSLFVDNTALSLILITPTGTIGRAMSAPKPSDVRLLGLSASGSDTRGNLVYRASAPRAETNLADQMLAMGARLQQPDSSPVVRASFETRSVDTIGLLKTSTTQRIGIDSLGGRTNLTLFINPLTSIDEWAVLSDGTIAFVRGRDYHVDIIRPNGQGFSGPKLSFDWKRLTDNEKQALIDSARMAREKQEKTAKANNASAPAVTLQDGGARIRVRGGPSASPTPSVKFDFVPLGDIPDYWPPIRLGATKADLDGNLWILPTTSAQSEVGELVYDVVNNRGAMTHRVRVPFGRSIAGFGKNGVVYLMHRDGASGWVLERTRVQQ